MLVVIVVQIQNAQRAINVLELPNAARTSKATSEHTVFPNLHWIRKPDFCWRMQVNPIQIIFVFTWCFDSWCFVIHRNSFINQPYFSLLFVIGIFHENEICLNLTICPRHRDAFGRWQGNRQTCSITSEWVTHRKSHVKGERGITLAQSRRLYKATDVLIPVGSSKLQRINS